MVDIIHSDRGVYGYPISTGTVDFYPNGGARYQPGCSGTIQLATDKGKKMEINFNLFLDSRFKS